MEELNTKIVTQKMASSDTHRITDANHFFLNPTDTIINRLCQTSRGTFWKVRIVFFFSTSSFLE